MYVRAELAVEREAGSGGNWGRGTFIYWGAEKKKSRAKRKSLWVCGAGNKRAGVVEKEEERGDAVKVGDVRKKNQKKKVWGSCNPMGDYKSAI